MTPAEPNEAAKLAPYEQAKRLFLLASATIAGGLAIAGALDRTTGGVILLIGWLLGIASLHRLGRTGSDRGGGGNNAGSGGAR